MKPFEKMDVKEAIGKYIAFGNNVSDELYVDFKNAQNKLYKTFNRYPSTNTYWIGEIVDVVKQVQSYLTILAATSKNVVVKRENSTKEELIAFNSLSSLCSIHIMVDGVTFLTKDFIEKLKDGKISLPCNIQLT